MRARRQPGRQESLAETGTNAWRTCTGRAVCAFTCIGTKTSRSPVQLCRRIGRFYGEVGHHLGGVEALGNAKAEETKRVALVLEVNDALPQVFIQLTTKPGMTYDELKQGDVVASSTYLTSDIERRDEAVVFQPRTDGTKAGTGLDSNQCEYCLKRNHTWRECRSYINGKPPAGRPPGMSPARKFSPPP